MTVPVVELTRYGEPSPLFCPVCGAAVWQTGELQPCPHLLFFQESDSRQCFWPHDPTRQAVLQVLENRYLAQGFSHLYPDLNSYEQSLGPASVTTLAVSCCPAAAAFLLSLTTCDPGCGSMVRESVQALFDFTSQSRLCSFS